MSTLLLKIMACAAMLIDHIGYFSVYGYAGAGDAMRIIGRIAFPIYCYLIAFGYRKTSDKYKYFLRLLILGLIAELPFQYCFYGKLNLLTLNNVYFTLALGLMAVICYDLMRREGGVMTYLSFIPPLLAALVSEFIVSDYGWAGVLLIFFFHLAGDNKYLCALCCMLFGARRVITAIAAAFFDSVINSYSFALPTISEWDFMQLYAAAALIPILLCSGKRGYRPKSRVWQKVIQYSFYFFYPVHLLAVGYVIRNFVM